MEKQGDLPNESDMYNVCSGSFGVSSGLSVKAGRECLLFCERATLALQSNGSIATGKRVSSKRRKPCRD